MLTLLLVALAAILSCARERPAPLAPAGKLGAALASLPAPANLTIAALTNSTARLEWDPVQGATDYDVNYREAIGGRWTNWPHRGASRTYTTIYDLAPDTRYRWAVRAENQDGASRWVFGANFTTLAEAEATPPPDEPTIPLTPTDTTFTIDLIFTDSFYGMGYTEADAEVIRYAASRWEALLYDIPDWSLGRGWQPATFQCGGPVIQSRQVDDLSLFIGGLDAGWDAGAIGYSQTDRGDWQTRAFGLAVEGCIRVKGGYAGEQLAMIVAHEIGHVLGFGAVDPFPPPRGFDGWLVMDPYSRDRARFIGPQAKLVWALAGGQGDVPMEGRYGGHWQWPTLSGTLMNPYGNTTDPFAITALDLAAFADMGYPVRMDQADPFVLSSRGRAKPTLAAHPSWCGM